MNNITAISIKNPLKSKCGDASYAGTITIGKDKFILLMVADGVSKAPKDWLASQSAISFIKEALEKSDSFAPKAFKTAVESATEKIYAGVDNTLGMLSTISAVLLSESQKKLWWFNAGDSRIYGLKNGTFKQLTTDDVTSLPYKENGKLKLLNGMPIIMSALTKAMGQPTLEVSLTELPFDEYEALVLASDGFYGLTKFENYLKELIQREDMDRMAIEIQETVLSEITDDASFAIIRIPNDIKIDLRSILAHGNGADLTTISVFNNLEVELIQAISQNDNGYLEQLLNFIEARNIFLNKQKMIELLELMIKHSSSLAPRMVAIIRKI